MRSSFAQILLDWAAKHGRSGLPWQPAPGEVADPYRVWLSEVMLQQTQLVSMLPYYHRFLAKFPGLAALASAPVEEVLAAWSGLGYYARARNLHRAAQQMVSQGLPARAADWAALPGVGRSTAAAISAVVSGERVAILDGNVRRVLARQVCSPHPWASGALERQLWPEAEARLPTDGRLMPAYTQAIMDLGALVCLPRQPNCQNCPVQADCQAFAQSEVDAYPRPAERRPRPRRLADWLLLRHPGAGEERWALVRRPSRGIWGGLLALPESSLPVETPEALGLTSRGEISHAFTHFQLQARVWSALLTGGLPASLPEALAALAAPRAAKPRPDESSPTRAGGLAEVWPEPDVLVWMTRREALAAGIPTPLRRLLLAD